MFEVYHTPPFLVFVDGPLFEPAENLGSPAPLYVFSPVTSSIDVRII
jgi:hypothetical protein